MLGVLHNGFVSIVWRVPWLGVSSEDRILPARRVTPRRSIRRSDAHRAPRKKVNGARVAFLRLRVKDGTDDAVVGETNRFRFPSDSFILSLTEKRSTTTTDDATKTTTKRRWRNISHRFLGRKRTGSTARFTLKLARVDTGTDARVYTTSRRRRKPFC